MLLKAMFENPLGMAREMDRLFDSMMTAQPYAFELSGAARWNYPPVNLWEDAEHVYVEAEIPGVTMKDMDVQVTDDQLILKGCRELSIAEGDRVLRRERPAGCFERTISLPVAIETDNVEAKLTNGVLFISLPKAAECKPRKVQVKALSTSGS